MTDKKKSSVEAIYPLSYMQQGLLMHHLSSKLDQGFLNTECTLSGDFNLSVFKASCILVSERHDVLRSTIHWKNLEKSLHVIHKKKDIQIEYLDWHNLNEEEKKINWDKLKAETFKIGSDLESGALLKIKVVKFLGSKHKLLWPIHHILLDGWSGSIIIKDLFNIYDALFNKKTPQLNTLPSYKAYLKWINSLPEEQAKTFWKTYLKDYKTPLLFSNYKVNDTPEELYTTNTFTLLEENTNQVKDYCKTNKITINTLVQCIWSLVLSKYFNKNNVMHGTTVSGRAVDFPNMDLIAGMFMNVQPIIGNINEGLDFSSWFQTMQKSHFEARKYEHIGLDKIYDYIDWSSNATLFDSLIVFENYPIVKTEENILKVSNIKSGLTSTYPVTLSVLPGNKTKFVLTTSSKYIDAEISLWLTETLKNIITLIVSEKVSNLSELSKTIIPPLKQLSSLNTVKESAINHSAYVAPKNKTELELIQIWESLLNINQISTNANFFEIGGKSLVAVKMFTIINQKFKTKLSATTLLENSTIEKLSNHITTDYKTNSFWRYIIPIRSKGNKNPVFCVHGGGGYAFFFNPLVKALNNNIPVYALQPAGLNNNEDMHESIEKMAIDYAKEIKDVQPEGPYNILTYCFSPAVGIEIANIFKLEGKETNLIVIDSIIKQEDFTNPDRIKMRVSGFLNRIITNPFNAIKLMILNNYARFLEPISIKLFAPESKKNLDKITRNLVKIYINYSWNKNHTDNVLLLLTQKADKKLNPMYIEAWKGITNGDIKVGNISGKHHELFKYPHVQSIAKQIEKNLYEL